MPDQRCLQRGHLHLSLIHIYSVVLVNNYQTTTYNNNSYGFFYGYGYGNPYGNGRGGTTSREQLAGTGSGTVISEYGHILTNYHVVEDASRVTVSDGENEYDATVVVSDESKDVAVLLCPELKATPATLGDSDKLQAGEWAIVIGNPLGEDFFRSTTVGVVLSLIHICTRAQCRRGIRRAGSHNRPPA